MVTRVGKIAVVGAGPGGMATALAAIRRGFEVKLFERFPEVKAAGNILNLWPPPQKILGLIGVDTGDLGAPCHTVFCNSRGKVRADVRLSEDVEREYGGGFIGLLRWGLYKRMLDKLPEGVLMLGHDVRAVDDEGDQVVLKFANGGEETFDVVIGADGIHSTIRSHLWGQEPARRQMLHLVGGWLFDERGANGEGVISHDRTTQVSYTPIRHEGQWGYEWWVLEAFDDASIPVDLNEFAITRARRFPAFVQELIARSPAENMQRWEIKDRPPLKQWSKGRVTLVGDAAHPTSPYAAYGAGMSIEDGYFLAHELGKVDVANTEQVCGALQAYEERRKAHTAYITELAYQMGRMFHHLPAPLRPIRDMFFDRSNFLQSKIGDEMPGEILAQLEEIDKAEQTYAYHLD